MKFLIFGAGAIGSAIGSKLSQSGHEVHLLGRKEHIIAIQKNGLDIDGIWGKYNVKDFYLHIEPPQDTFYDVVFITVKTFSTEEAAKIISQNNIKAKIFISAQNGLGNYEILSNYISPVACARIIFGVVFNSPGKINITVWGGPILLGFWEKNYDQDLKRFLIKVAEVLSESGLPSEFCNDIRTPIWEKAIYNSALNPLSVILNSTYGEVVDNEFSCAIVKEIISEGVYVGKKEGANLPENFFDYFMQKLIPPTSSHISSMIQDIKLRGKTEIDSMCGAIVKYGLKHNFFPKVNFTMWKLIKSIERINEKQEQKISRETT
jgi:2-dehydropantoate 2-reductase